MEPLEDFKISKGRPGRKKIVTPEAIEALYSEDNPDALINVLPMRLVPVLKRVREKIPRILLADERDIRRYVEPTERCDRLRLSFWDEYNASTACSKRMSLQSILSGICAWESWITVYEPNDKRMVWLFTPPTNYVAMMRQILHRGTERLLEIMNLPMFNDDGKVDVRTAQLVLRAWQLADMRVKGGVTQRVQIEQKSMNVNVDTDINQMREQVNGLQLHELEALERRIERAKRDQAKLLKKADPAQVELILEAPLRGDTVMLEDLENMTSAKSRYNLPDLPELPKLPTVDEVLSGSSQNDKE